jgi:integrase
VAIPQETSKTIVDLKRQKKTSKNSKSGPEVAQWPKSALPREKRGKQQKKARGENPKSGPVVGTVGKGDVRYWQSNVVRRTYKSGEAVAKVTSWCARMQHQGRREWFNLGTSNQAVAALKAKDIYAFLQLNGWEATRTKYKPKTVVLFKTDATVGEFLDELSTRADSKSKTLEGYAIAFRKIVADIIGLSHGRGGGKKKRNVWREKIHAVRLASITPSKVQRWKLDFVARAGSDPAKQRVARISANTFIRRAKSLFAQDMVKHLETVVLPSPLPFAGVDFYKRTSMRYRSSFDVATLIKQAEEDLSVAEPEQFKIFLLGVMAGLRRNEIDKLQWSAFRWDQGAIRIEATKWFHPKSEDSLGDVEIDPELVAIFRGYRAKAKGSFVIESSVKPRLDVGWEHYRCTSIFEGLIEWLHGNGVESTHPLHTLRKEFGSQIAAKHGIYAASRLLRHADIHTTASHYLDKKTRITAGLGGMLGTSNVVSL